MLLLELPDVLRAAGLKVVEVSGWQNRMREPMTGVNGIVCHHTGSKSKPSDGGDYPSLSVVRDGRDLGTPSELKGPLANLGLGFSGTWYVIASGKANHAGAVLRDSWSSWHMIGIEAQGDGVSAWPAEQYRSYAVGCEALSAHYGFPIAEILGHKEVCSPVGRKNDPNFDMRSFRALVAQIRQERNDDVTPQDKKDIIDRTARAAAAAVVEALVIQTDWSADGLTDGVGALVPFKKAIAETRGYVLNTALQKVPAMEKDIDAIKAQLARIESLLTPPVPGP